MTNKSLEVAPADAAFADVIQDYYHNKPNSPEEATEFIRTQLGIPVDQTHNPDLLADVADSLQFDWISPDKIKRRLGLEMGPYTPEQRRSIREATQSFLPVAMKKCEDQGYPLVAIIGFGSVFDTRMGLTPESDVDLMIIPLGDERQVAEAAQVIQTAYGANPPSPILHTDVTPTGWVTSTSLVERDKSGKPIRYASTPLIHVKPGSCVLVRDQQWADLLEKHFSFAERGCDVVVYTQDSEK